MDQTTRERYIAALTATPGMQMIPVWVIGEPGAVASSVMALIALGESEPPAITIRSPGEDGHGLVTGIAWIALSPEHATREWLTGPSGIGPIAARIPVMVISALLLDEDDARASVLSWSGVSFEGAKEYWSNTPDDPAELTALLDENGVPDLTYLWTGRTFAAETFAGA